MLKTLHQFIRATLQVADTGTVHKIKIFKIDAHGIINGTLTGIHNIETAYFTFAIIKKNGKQMDEIQIDILDIGEGSNWVAITLKNFLAANEWTRIGTPDTKI